MANETIIIKCGECGTKNRIPLSRINDFPVCGRCRAPLKMPKIYNEPVHVTDQSFESQVLESSYPVLLDCWAPWCQPCQTLSPVLTRLAKKYAGRIKIAKLNVDQNPVTASGYNVLSVPTMLLFKNGQLINALAGTYFEKDIEKHIEYITQDG